MQTDPGDQEKELAEEKVPAVAEHLRRVVTDRNPEQDSSIVHGLRVVRCLFKEEFLKEDLLIYSG
jgi:hypothetical protein